jgi:hypothetical protein
MNKEVTKSIWPALTLMILAPLIAEVLPGATRFSSLFVFPIEVVVWGGGALLIRHVVRKWQLGWIHMILLGVVLSLAEECLIQQTSLAPLVIQIKGVTYARAFGINYVYLLWALIYETVLVVIIPIHLTEIIFANHRQESWIGRKGVVSVSILFLVGCYLAWFSWTQIARTKVFHLPAYTPPLILVLIAVLLILCLIYIAMGPYKRKLTPVLASIKTPSEWILFILGASWAVILYGLVMLAFGISPAFPEWIALTSGLILAGTAIYWVPRWIPTPGNQTSHLYFIIFGVITGAMSAGFIGFGTAKNDLYFKIMVDLLAFVLLIMLGLRIKKNPVR